MAQKAKHAALNGQISDGAQALVQPCWLKWSLHIIEQAKSIRKVGGQNVAMPELPGDIMSNNELYGCTASTMPMEVKMQSGQTKEEPTLLCLLRHLPKYKAPGCVGDRYEHYLAMPFALVESGTQHIAYAKCDLGLQISAGISWATTGAIPEVLKTAGIVTLAPQIHPG